MSPTFLIQPVPAKVRGLAANGTDAVSDAVAAEVAATWAQGRAVSISLRSRTPFLPQPAAPAGTSGRKCS